MVYFNGGIKGMELKVIVEAINSLKKLDKLDLPIKTSYRISRFVSEADVQFQLFDKQRTKLFDKHNVKVFEDGRLSCSKENFEEFQKEFEELLSVDVDIKFKDIVIKATDDIKLSSEDVRLLSKLFEFEMDDE